MLLELHCNILWVAELPRVQVWCNQFWFYSLILFGYLYLLSFNCLWFDLCLIMTWSIIYLTCLDWVGKPISICGPIKSSYMYWMLHGIPEWMLEEKVLHIKSRTHSTRSWGITLDLESLSLGSSVSGMNLDLHRKSTPMTLNDFQSKQDSSGVVEEDEINHFIAPTPLNLSNN